MDQTPADDTTFTREDGSQGVWLNGLPRTTDDAPATPSTGDTMNDNSALTEAIDQTHADALSALHKFMDAVICYEAATGNSPLNGEVYGRVFSQDMESALFQFADILSDRYDEN